VEPGKVVMKINRTIISNLNTLSSKPGESIFALPEKVLQFGTGVLLRGLPDYFIDKANKQGIFNGRIVVVKSTSNGGTDAFETQDGLYTHCIKGIQHNKVVEEYILNASISRVLSAAEQWNEIIKLAGNKDMQVIISNTTESGIVLDKNDKITNEPPVSFPGKLLAFLFERWKIFGGTAESGMVIVPAELISDNGTILRSIVNELAALNQLEQSFIDWLNTYNHFCNSLVDRIVPGKLPAAQQSEVEQTLGYEDELMIMSEVYSLWAIEAKNEIVKEKLSFAKADGSVIITDSILKYKELKLRLLNGTHTFSCGLACLAGFETVKDALQDNNFKTYIENLMHEEIAPAIISGMISEKEAHAFADSVIDRFANPHIDHKWISITMNFTSKMQMRNVPLLLEHYKTNSRVPQLMAFGFAAYLRFIQIAKEENGKYLGTFNGKSYVIDDPKAATFKTAWGNNNSVREILANTEIWNADLSALPGFASTVNEYLDRINDGQLSQLFAELSKKEMKVSA
jgi:tagaturonate reductase